MGLSYLSHFQLIIIFQGVYEQFNLEMVAIIVEGCIEYSTTDEMTTTTGEASSTDGSYESTEGSYESTEGSYETEATTEGIGINHMLVSFNLNK
jgi:hypothetical protein